MQRNIESEWWRLELPPGWSGQRQETWAEIVPSNAVGALHISCTKKKAGPVSHGDIQKWAAEHTHPELAWHSIQLGCFSGLRRERSEQGLFWVEFYLACGHLMFFVTYNCELGREGANRADIERIVTRIECLDDGA
jgi:hypothetical protein